MRNKTQLPFENFAVLNDETKEFKEYIRWLNEQFNRNASPLFREYYGFANGETSVKDFTYFKNRNSTILSAKEFMDIVNLPIDWVIERNEENYKEVNEWINKVNHPYVCNTNYGAVHSKPIDKSPIPQTSMFQCKGFTLITTEQFRLWRKWFDKEVKEEVKPLTQDFVDKFNNLTKEEVKQIFHGVAPNSHGIEWVKVEQTDEQLIELLSNRGYRIYKEVVETIEVTNKTA